jgi:hypothetical protein
LELVTKNRTVSQVPVAHIYNPSYLGGRDQEDHGLKPAQANSSMRPYLKKTLHNKRAGGVAQGVGLEFKPQFCKTTTKEQDYKIGTVG